jgi:diguanylate cyclase (GGDEF)-like protein
LHLFRIVGSARKIGQAQGGSMARSHSNVSQAAFARDARLRTAERRCEDYRRAFLLLLDEPYDDLHKMIERMLEVLATTLDVGRVGFWTFDDNYQSLRCEHFYNRDPARPIGPTRLARSDFPTYFDAVCEELVLCANDARSDPRTAALATEYLEPLDVHSMLDVPVRAFGRYVGVLCHEMQGEARQWTPEDEHFASGVATQIALAFERDQAKRAQQELLERSLRDEDSQLANRLHLERALDAYCGNPSRVGALVIASVDQYKYVAGSLGTRRMQMLLRHFGARLIAAAPEATLVARVGPNEFALLLRHVARKDVPPVVAQIKAAAKLPLVSDGQRLFLSLSTGYSLIEATAQQSAESLIGEAHMAMHEAQTAGGDHTVAFTSKMRHVMRERVAIEQDLRRGLDAAEFDLHFQPIICLKTGVAHSVEALLRWRHPRHGLLAPDAFMGVAIESGIMLELGRRVLAAACTSLARLRAQPGLEDMTMTINMSAPEVLLPGTADAVRLELLRNELPPRALAIEITETALIVDMDRAVSAVAEIREIGVNISLDDFGTAYSSLTWLRRLPIDKIKIDRAFVAGIEREACDLAIVKSVIQLAKAFKHEVVAEGVETPGQLSILRELGVDYVQGFLFARPAPLETLSAASLGSFMIAP